MKKLSLKKEFIRVLVGGLELVLGGQPNDTDTFICSIPCTQTCDRSDCIGCQTMRPNTACV
jgi:hypothetical protein